MARTKQQKQLIVLVVLLVAAGALWYAYGHQQQATGPGSDGKTQFKKIKAENLGDIILDLEKAQKTEYKSAGRNIFVMGPMPVETAPGVPVTQKEPFRVYNQPQLPPPPQPATLPPGWIFYGYGVVPAGKQRLAFFKEPDNDSPHIVSEGELLQNHIRILHIGNDRVDFEDINTGQKGSKTLEAPPSA
jgi:hypothetical protein